MFNDVKNGVIEVRSRCPRSVARRLAYVVLGVCVWSLVAWAASRALIVESNARCDVDAIIVLAGADSYRARAARAAELYAEGCAPFVVLTNDGMRGGWSQTEQRTLMYVERARRELQRAGVPQERIIILPKVMSGTHDEAIHVRDEAERRGWRRLMIVTSPYHTRRARWSFRRAFDGSGTEVYCQSARFDDDAPAVWWLDAKGWRDVAGEYVKFAYYSLLIH